MKRYIHFKLLLLLCIVSSAVLAAPPDETAEKTIVREADLCNQKLSITNTFGTVRVHNWEQAGRYKVVIKIFVSSKSEALTTTIMNQIDIKISENPLKYETTIGANKGQRQVEVKSGNSKMQIDYDVYLPANAPLYVKNSFGNMFIDDRIGKTTLAQSFGTLNIGKLKNVEDILIEFGNLNADALDVKKLSSNYSKINIKTLEGSARGSFDFCDKLDIGLSDKLDTLAINSTYSNMKLNITDLQDGLLIINNSLGNVKNNSRSVQINTSDNNTGKSQVYKLKSGQGKTYIKINNSFGNIKFD